MGYFLRRDDVLLFRSASKLGAAVREGQRVPGQRYAPAVNHVGLVVRDGEPAKSPSAVIVEAGGKGVERRALYPAHGDDFVWCYRPVAVPPNGLEGIVRRIELRVGEPYSFFEMLTQLADHKLFRGHVVTRWLTRPIWGGQCSTLVSEEFAHADHPISAKRPWASTPADVERFLLDHPHEFVVTWNGKPSEWAGAAA